MEMKSTVRLLCRCFFSCILLLLLPLHPLQAQQPVKNYTVKNGKMYITLAKNLPAASLDSFVNKYNLADLALPQFMQNSNADSLHKLGWTVVLSNSEIVVIAKPLLGFDKMDNPADKIIFTQNEEMAARFAPVSNQVHFGYNQFKNKNAFAVNDSAVTFFMRGNTNAAKVMLAGSFNNWQPDALAMLKTDSGWTATVKLGMGKYWYKFIVDGNWTVDKDNHQTENDGMGNDNSVYFKTNYSFTLNGFTGAKKVFVAGSFNDWRTNELRMLPTATGWELPVYLSEGTHTYRFIADNRWMADPANSDQLPNEYNESNSVLRIGNPFLFKLDGFTTAQKIVLLGSFNKWRDDELFMKKTATGWELPYTLGPGNYQYRLKIDGQYTADSITGENLALVIDPNFTFRLKGYDSAKTVCVAGDINDWNPSSFQMKRSGNEWIFNVHLNKGKHRYKFVVDGKWIVDPDNKLWEENEYQTGNSIVWIGVD
jgi:Glycogen recognition site of AMP-activated protein kinase